MMRPKVSGVYSTLVAITLPAMSTLVAIPLSSCVPAEDPQSSVALGQNLSATTKPGPFANSRPGLFGVAVPDPTSPVHPDSAALNNLGTGGVRMEYIWGSGSGGSIHWFDDPTNALMQTGVPAAVSSYYDGSINDYHGAHKSLLVILGGDTVKDWESDYLSDNWPSYVVRFMDRAGTIAAAYGSTVNAYEIFNEEDLPSGDGKVARIEPGDYALLLGEACQAIKAQSPTTHVVMGGVASPGKFDYIRAVAAAMSASGTWSCVDAVADHLYEDYVDAAHQYKYDDVKSDGQTALWHELNNLKNSVAGKYLMFSEWGTRRDDGGTDQTLLRYNIDAFFTLMREHGTSDPFSLLHNAFFFSYFSGQSDMDLMNSDNTPKDSWKMFQAEYQK